MRSRWPGLVLVVAALLALGGSVVTGYQQHAYAQCQAKVNEQLIRSTSARAAAAEQDHAALDEMIRAVSVATSREQSDSALAAYRKKRDEADEERKRNPLPAPPSQTCR